MKLILKLIKFLLITLVSILIIPVTLVVLMYKSVTPPSYETSTVNLESVIKESVDTFLDKTEAPFTFNLGVNEELLNIELNKKLEDQFESDDEDYVYVEDRVKYQGTWVTFKDDTIDVISGIHFDSSIMTFKTRVLLSFIIDDSSLKNGKIVLKLDKINVGNLPLAWLVSMSPGILNTLTGKDINEMVDNAFGDIGELDIKKRELTIDIYRVTYKLDENKELVNLLLTKVLGSELLSLGVDEIDSEYLLNLGIDFTQLKTTYKDIVLSDKIENENEFKLFLSQKALESLILNNKKIVFNEIEFNQIFDYLLNTIEGSLFSGKFYSDYKLDVKKPIVNLDGENLDIIIPITIGNETKVFTTGLKASLELIRKENDNSLYLSIKNVVIGEFNFESEEIETIISKFATDKMELVNGEFIIKDFFAKFDQPGIEFKDISVNDGNVEFNYETNLSDILDTIISEDSIPDVIKDKAQEILDKKNNNELDIDEEINDILDLIEGLSEDEKNDLLDKIKNSFLP
ncbi:MAG: hypothetical protein RBQ97_03885 [Acholeplasma sp.]|nr:hypothetical protein [Acholeplasma sp.]